jgi:hypothetical protein
MSYDILPYQELVLYVDTSQVLAKKKARFVAIVEGDGISDILIPTTSFDVDNNPVFSEMFGMLTALKYVRQNYDFDSLIIICDCLSVNNGINGIIKKYKGKQGDLLNSTKDQIKKELFGYPFKVLHRSEKDSDHLYACDRISRYVMKSPQVVHSTNKVFKQYEWIRQIFSEYNRIFI